MLGPRALRGVVSGHCPWLLAALFLLGGCATTPQRANRPSALASTSTAPPTSISTTTSATAPRPVAPPTTPAPPPPPVRILFAGDSMSGSVAVGVAEVAGQYGAEVVARGEATCSPTIDQMVRIKSDLVAPKSPCVPGSPGAIIADLSAWVQQYDPDVVVYMSRSDLFDDEVGGSWVTVGQPAANGFITTQLDRTVAALASGGAHVVLVTNPPYHSGQQPNGSEWPEDSPQRAAADDAILHQVAASNGATVSIVDGAALFGSGADAAAGAPVRCPDGVHVAPAGGRFFARQVMPEVVALGRAHALANRQRAPLGPQPSRPAWWGEIMCGP